MGVFLYRTAVTASRSCLPHARGGVSLPAIAPIRTRASSPRTWGCFPLSHLNARAAESLPHARGGVSRYRNFSETFFSSSPRTWGCFYLPWAQWRYSSVFPTHVGVFLVELLGYPVQHCLPHARGGVSNTPTMSSCGLPSSPRTWGCFSSTCGGC